MALKCCQSCCIYAVIILNIIYNFLVVFFLCFCCRDISLLAAYQKMFLILSLIDFILLTLYYLGEFILVVINKMPKKRAVKLVWLCLNAPASLFILITLIYDFVILGKKLMFFAYIILELFLVLLFVLFSFLAYRHIDLIYKNSICITQNQRKNDENVSFVDPNGSSPERIIELSDKNKQN